MSTPDMNLEAVTILTGLLLALGKWAYGKVTGKKQEDLSELLDEAITAELADALEDGETLDTIEDRLSGVALKLAKKVGVKLPENTVRVAIQYGVVEFRKRLRERERNQKAAKELPAKADELRVGAAGVVAAFDKLTPNVAIDTMTPKEPGNELIEP